MKKAIFALTAGCIIVFSAVTTAFAQNAVSGQAQEIPENSIAISNAKPVLISGHTSTSARALKNFGKEYKNVSGAQWFDVSDGYRVRFNADGKTIVVYYNKNGNWVGSLKGYTEDKLPYKVRDMVKRAYYDYSITYVDEAETINSHREPTYFIHLEDKTSIKLIRIWEGEMEVWKQFQKQQ